MRFILIVIAFLIVVNIQIFSQSEYKSNLKVTITERVFPGPNPDIVYKIRRQNMKVYSLDIWKRIKIGNRRLLYAIRLEPFIYDSLNILVQSLDLEALNNSYSGIWIDGVMWTFAFKVGHCRKEVLLDNYYLPDFDPILSLINEIIPDSIAKISFDHFGIKENFIGE